MFRDDKPLDIVEFAEVLRVQDGLDVGGGLVRRLVRGEHAPEALRVPHYDRVEALLDGD